MWFQSLVIFNTTNVYFLFYFFFTSTSVNVTNFLLKNLQLQCCPPIHIHLTPFLKLNAANTKESLKFTLPAS